MGGEVAPVSAGHSRKTIYVLVAWVLLLQCAFTGLQWQSFFPSKQQHVQKQQQPAAPASPPNKYFKPMAGELEICITEVILRMRLSPAVCAISNCVTCNCQFTNKRPCA